MSSSLGISAIHSALYFSPMPSKKATALSRSQTSRVIALVALDDLAHARLDLFEILGRERRVAREIVIEAVLGRRAEGDLRLGVELLDRLGHDVRGVVTDDFEPVRLVAGDDRDLGVMVDDGREVARAAVKLQRDRRLGEAGADRRRKLRRR